MSKNFDASFRQANLASTNDIGDFVKKKTDFDDKLKNLNKKVTLDKAKRLLVQNGLNKLSEDVELISSKRLAKDLLGKYSILNSARYFSFNESKSYLLFQPI